MTQDISFLKTFVGMSKKDIPIFASVTLDNAIDNGNDALNMVAIGAKMEMLGKELKDKGSKRSELINEVLREDNKKKVLSGVTLSIREVGVEYDYSATPIIGEIEKEVLRLNTEKKAIQDIAKIIKQRAEYTTSDGEQVVIMPATSKSTTSIVASIL